MHRQTLIDTLQASGIRPTSDTDIDAIERTATFLRDSADRVAAWLKEAGK